MNRKFASGLAAALLSSAVLVSQGVVSKAADLASDTQPYFLWSGLYAGAYLSSMMSGDSGFHGGGVLGYNWQRGRLVFGVEGDLSTNSTSSIAGRVGYEFTPRWLVYGKVGTGFGDHEEGGAFFGVGAEYAFTHRWSAKVEFDNLNRGGDHDHSSSVVKAGVNYKFGPGWPF